MLKRKIETILNGWQTLSKKPALLIMGARQVGKTTSIRDFAKKKYESFIELNFEERPSLKRIFEGDLDADTIYEKLSVVGLGKLVPKRTLLFFDEIQSCPNARTAIKFLVENGTYDIIESGSLLGINYADVSSFPVGFEKKVEMHSLDFEEFLWAVDMPLETIETVKRHFENRTAVDPFIHTKWMEWFQRYLIIGGMPAVITKYLEQRNIQAAMESQKNILNSYRDDIAKYAGKMKGIAKAVFDSIPSQLASKNKKFVLAQIEDGASNRKYSDPIFWLHDAGIASFCYNITQLVLPFEWNERRNNYKFFMRDTGLLSLMSLGNVQQALLNGELDINEGAITENAIADLLMKNGHALHYYDVKGRLEIDFVLNLHQKVVPVEVKSGADYYRHTSLTNLLANESRFLDTAIVLCKGNVSVHDNITYYPLYMVMFLSA